MTLSEKDKAYLWHPFTAMDQWCASDHQPLTIDRGEGVHLYDTDGNCYIDGNASIWTNIHGHSHPVIDSAIREQLDRIAHCSFLGTTSEPAILLAEKLIGLFPRATLSRVFFSDDGSTAVECALKMAVQYCQLTGQQERVEFIAFDGAYHGDTLGAAALGKISAFHQRFEGMGMAVRHLQSSAQLQDIDGTKIAAVVIEPLVQGAAGIRLWPRGMLRELRQWCDDNGVLLIFDEVMTGFGRTGKMFACEHEGVLPDLMALAKGLTGGYLPLAATLATARIYEAFLGGSERTFYYGHSYSGNPLGSAAALASLRVFEQERTLEGLPAKVEHLAVALGCMQEANPYVGEVRQCGLIAGIDLSGGDGILGTRSCVAARKHGLLTRAIGDTVVFMPPLVITPAQIDTALAALERGIGEAVV
ncbi:MAG: adenosylmethionine--8-amino-7-oxononanoate transaminase [Verrucomicrobiales bacterium]